MADRRRRRKLAGDEDSDGGSEASDEETNGVRKSTAGSDGGDSEYESADEEELLEEEEEDDEEEELLQTADGVLVDKDKQLDDDEDRKNPQYIPKKGTFYEHDDRTAATEEDTAKEVPKEPPVKKEVASKKKVWKEDDRWNHDRFNEYDQAPKSREELIAVYGYDIRNEEGPPRARRRRRYGRGPNKYTRNWEDLDAYSKPTRGGGSPGLRGRGGMRSLGGSRKTLESEEEFPALGSTQPHLKDSSEDIVSRPDSQEQHWPAPDSYRGDGEHPMKHQHQPPPHSQPPSKQQQQQQQQQIPPNQQPPLQYSSHKSPGMSPQSQDQRSDGYGMRGKGPRGGRGGRGSWRGHFKDQYRNSDERPGYGHGEGKQSVRGGRGGYQQQQQQRAQPLNPQQHQHQQHQHQEQQHHQHQHTPREVDDVMVDMKNLSVSSQNRDEAYRGKNRGGGGGVDNRRNNMPPRLQQDSAVVANMAGRGGRGGNASPADGSSSRPKRYSSQRQRSIPEQPVPPYTQQHGYLEGPVETGYQGGVSDAGIVTSTNHSVTVPHTQLPLAGGAPPTFVPPAFTTSPPTYPTEPFLGSPPAPRMFPPVTQAPHLFGPPVAPPVPVPGPPVAGPPPVAPLGAPPVGAPTVPGPPVTGPPFLPPENMINFGAHPGPLPGAAPHPPQFPPFQGYTPGPVVSASQPGEIYSNGVTYYNTESQQQLPRANLPLQKRPKAAIPIVPPPERERLRREAQGREQGSAALESQDDSEDYPMEGESYEDAPQHQHQHQEPQQPEPQQQQQQQVEREQKQEETPEQQQQPKETQQYKETKQPEPQPAQQEQQQLQQQQDQSKQEKEPEKQQTEVKTEPEKSEQHNQPQEQDKPQEQRKEQEEVRETASSGSSAAPQEATKGVATTVAGQETVAAPGEVEAAPAEQQQQSSEAVAAAS